MSEDLDQIVYSKNVLDFVTVGNEYCNQLENAGNLSTKEFLTVIVRLLPLLYIKTLTLPKVEFVLEESVEKAVREEDYIRIQHDLLNKLGGLDDFLEIYVPENDIDQQEVASSISENLTDIYQDVKDFLFSYKIGVTEVMNDALVEMINSFELFWGQKLTNVLRACHHILYSNKDIEEESAGGYGSEETSGNDSWFSRFQDQWGDEDN